MKLGLFTLAALATAQKIQITSPDYNAYLVKDDFFPFTVQTPNDGKEVQEISIVLSILKCPKGKCPDAIKGLGTVLYSGPFHPTGRDVPEQTFNVSIPSGFATGPAELVAAHFALVGAEHTPALRLWSKSVYVGDK